MEKHERWLWKQLPDWLEKGIVTLEGADALRALYPDGDEAASRSSTGKLAMILLSSIGALLIGLGIIALFAANWASLSRPCRGVLSLTPLTLCGILAIVAFARRWTARAFWESLGIFWSIAIWSGFALVCQTYQLSDNIAGFVLACTLLCLPVVYLTRSVSATIAWTVYPIIWLAIQAADDVYSRWHSLAYLLLALLAIPACYFCWKRLKFRALLEIFVSAAESIGACVALVFFLDKDDAGPDVFYYWTYLPFSIGCIMWLLAGVTAWRRQCDIALLWMLYPCLVVPSLSFLSGGRSLSCPTDIAGIIVNAALLVAVWALAFWLLSRKMDESQCFLNREKTCAVPIILLLVYGMLWLPGEYVPITCYAIVIGAAVLALIQALRTLRQFQMNLALCVLVYQILVKFLVSTCSFTLKGIILVSCGVAVLLANVFFIRKRRDASTISTNEENPQP